MEPPALRRGRSVKAQRRMSVCVAVLVGKALVKAAAKAEAKVEAKPKEEAWIGIEDFAKVELRVAEVLAAEKHPNADRLLVLRLSLGNEERTVVSGIAKWYRPEELVGKKVVLVANLKPAKLRGIESQGMILAAQEGEALALVTVEGEVPPGAVVK